ncbi:unnamed protein product [Macrosiphum euphorbiae]|uniref:Uncharacterized protein n=1 Tax=Macrosiphum euphorbiae TaxID=13131 RepID=A0AAV0X7Y1_9HEMI|nr:unnamed protein product [Macrosiphum euphorbiae]
MAEDFDLSCTNKFEVELGSSLRHCCNTSRKLKQLALNAAELKINNQIDLTCKENDVGLSVKNILDAVQNLRGKLNIIETTFDCSDKTVFNLGETVQELESVVNIVSKNKNTIFTHRNLL